MFLIKTVSKVTYKFFWKKEINYFNFDNIENSLMNKLEEYPQFPIYIFFINI